MKESTQACRVEWDEIRENVLFFMIAEIDPSWVESDDDRKKWRFFERSTWEVRWYPTNPSPQRIAKAEQLCSKG